MTDLHGGAGSRRNDILAVSAKLFADTGFDETTMRQIGAASGIQAASLYHHFKTKDEILDVIIRTFLLSLPEKYNTIIATVRKPKKILYEFVELALRISLENSVVLSIVIRERKMLARRPDFAYVEQAFREVEGIWLSVLKNGIQQGTFREDLNPHVVLRMILGLMGSAVEWYRPNSRRYTQADVIRTELSFIFQGLLAT